MKIIILNDLVKANYDQDKLVLEIPFTLVFLTRENVRLHKIINQKTSDAINLISVYKEAGEEIKFPKTLEKSDFNNKELVLKIVFKSGLKGKIDFNLMFQFDFNEESNLNVIYKTVLNIKDNGSFQDITFNKYDPWTQYVGVVLIALMLLIMYGWNMFNTDVYKEEGGSFNFIFGYLTNPGILSIAPTMLVLFLGVNLKNIMNMPKEKKLTFLLNFFNFLEFYVEPTLLNIIRKKGWIVIISIFFILITALAYIFTPIKLPNISDDNLSYYHKGKEILQKKIYRNYAKDVKFGIKSDLVVNKKEERIYIGNIEDKFFNLDTVPYKFRFCDFCNNKSDSMLMIKSDEINIMKIIKEQNKDFEFDIYAKLKGVKDSISFREYSHAKVFFYNKPRTPLDVNSVLKAFNEYHSEENEFISDLYNNFEYSKFEGKYLPDTKKLLEKIFNASLISEDSLIKCYEALCFFKKYINDSNYVFNDNEIFVNLLKLNSFLRVTAGKMNHHKTTYCEKIIDEYKQFFSPYFNYKCLEISRDYTIIELYSDLIFCLEDAGLKSDCRFLNVFNRIYKDSKEFNKDNTHTDSTIENSFRNDLAKIIFIESARFNIDSNQFKNTFTDINFDLLRLEKDYIINSIDTNRENRYYIDFIKRN
jgi:hypothetical protein